VVGTAPMRPAKTAKTLPANSSLRDVNEDICYSSSPRYFLPIKLTTFQLIA
jgi:hypothetical protein